MSDAPREIFAWPDADGWTGTDGPDWENYGGFIKGYNGPCHWMGLNAVPYVRKDESKAREQAAYKSALEEAANIAEGMSFPMQDTANQSAGLPTAGEQVAANIRFKIQEAEG